MNHKNTHANMQLFINLPVELENVDDFVAFFS